MNRCMRSYGICLRGWPSNCCCEVGVCKLAISDKQLCPLRYCGSKPGCFVALCLSSSQHVQWQHLKISHGCLFLSYHHLRSYPHTHAYSSFPPCALIDPIPPPLPRSKLKSCPRHLRPEDESQKFLRNVCTSPPNFTEVNIRLSVSFFSFFFILISPNQSLSHTITLSDTHTHTPQSVELLWTSDQPDAETTLPDNTQHSQETDIHPPVGIRTLNHSKLAVEDPRLRERGHCDRPNSS